MWLAFKSRIIFSQFCDIFSPPKFLPLELKSFLTPLKSFLIDIAEFKSKMPTTHSPLKHELKEESAKPECKELPNREGGKVFNMLICMD